MSLLMEALKRAEQAKRQAERSAKPEGDGPGTATAAGRAGTTHLELLDEDLAGIAVARPAPARSEPRPTTVSAPDGSARQRQVAQNVFAAKQPVTARSAFPLLVGIGSAVALAGIAGYFWWQLQPRNPGLALAPGAVPVATPQTSAAAPAALPAAARPDRVPAPAAAPAVAGPDTPVAAPDKPVKEKSQPRATAIAPRKPAAETRGADRPQQPAADAQMPIRVSRGVKQVNPDLAAGYRQFQAGDLSGARRSYEQALRSDPRSVDALNGLAAVAAREGRGAEAQQYYLRALEADPQDTTAQSALALMGESGDPVQTESRLKLLLARQPDAHAARFALGNLYASQRQWREAQQAYFDAHAADPENPDYLFNLAVSLDQLSQPRLALEFYRKALVAASGRPAAFPRDQAESRVRELGVQ
jgi:Tfp pilus assembly protein PilF